MRTAIIADDEPIIRMDLAEILRELEFDVVGTVSDGFEAIELCRRAKPDLALLDIKMPVFDGLSAAQTIVREELAGCVVLLTAYCDREFLEQAKEAGVAGYLVKPIDERTLRPALEIALAQSSRYHDATKNVQRLEQELRDKAAIEQAKGIIARRDGISEKEAYAQMRKLSMDRQRPLGEIARMLIDSDPERRLVAQAKEFLMKRYAMNESTAFRKIKELSAARGCSLAEAARKVLQAGQPGAPGRRTVT